MILAKEIVCFVDDDLSAGKDIIKNYSEIPMIQKGRLIDYSQGLDYFVIGSNLYYDEICDVLVSEYEIDEERIIDIKTWVIANRYPLKRDNNSIFNIVEKTRSISQSIYAKAKCLPTEKRH